MNPDLLIFLGITAFFWLNVLFWIKATDPLADDGLLFAWKIWSGIMKWSGILFLYLALTGWKLPKGLDSK